MVDKNVGINVKLKLDSKGFSAKLDALARDFKPLEVPIKMNASGAGVKVQLDTSALESSFSKVGEKISKSISDSVSSLKPSSLGNLFSSVLAPLQSIATGAFEGVGRELSVKLGTGIAKGIEKQAAPVIGSFDLLGEKIITSAIPKLKDTVGGRIAGALLNRDSIKGKVAEFQKAIASTIGETDLLISQESGKLIAQRDFRKQVMLARKSLGGQLAEFVGQTPQRLQQALGLKARDKKLQKDQASAQAEAQKTSADLAAKKQQLTQKQDAIIAKAEEAGITVDDKYRAFVRKQVMGNKKTQEELAALEKANAKALSSLSAIATSREKIRVEIASITNPISPVVGKLEMLGISSDEIKAARDRVGSVSLQAKEIISNINNSISGDVAKIGNLEKEIEDYKLKIKNLIDDYNFNINFAETQDDRANLLKELVKGRREVLIEIQQIEQKISRTIQVSKEKQSLVSNAQTRSNKKIQQATLEANSAYQKAQIKIANQALGRKSEPQSSPSNTAVPKTKKTDNQLTDEARKIYEQVVTKVANLSGVNISQKDIPRVMAADMRKLIGEADAAYSPVNNTIVLDKTKAARLNQGEVSPDLIEALVHELRHALQFGLGKNIEGNAIPLMNPNQQESQRIAERINASVSMVNKEKIETDKIRSLETDAYTFADRYTQEIIDFVRGISNVKPVSLKTKLSDAQKELAQTRKLAADEAFKSLAEENKANLSQLTIKQLKQIAKSSGLSGYSGKNKVALQEMLASSLSPDDLSFRIPVFSKVNPLVEKDAAELAKLAPNQIKEQIKELSGSFRKAIALAGKQQNPQALREVLDNIAQAKNIYVAALAQDIEQESRKFLQSAIASLGKQRIAAQSRLIPLNAAQLNSSVSRPGATSVQQSVNDPLAGALFSVGRRRSIVPPSIEVLVRRLQKPQNPGVAKADNAVKELEKIAVEAKKLVSRLVKDVNQGVTNRINNATQNLRQLTKKTESLEKDQKRRQQQIISSSQKSYAQSQAALRELEAQTSKQVSEIESRTKYKQQQQDRAQRQRLQGYGIDQTAPVEVGVTPPLTPSFSLGGLVGKARAEINTFRSEAARKQASVLGTQAQAILVDLDSQTAIGKAAIAEAKLLNKQIGENEKRIQRILATVKASQQGKIPRLSPGDLQRLSGQLQQLGTMVDTDKTRVAQLQPAIAQARSIQPVRSDLRKSLQGAEGISSQAKISGEDLTRLSQYNKELARSLKLLGANPPKGPFGGILDDLNLKIPSVVKNTWSLVKGFLAFNVLSMVSTQLQQLGAEAFQTSIRFQSLETSLRFVSGSSLDGAENLAFLREQVERLSLPLEGTIRGFTSLTAAARGTSLEGARTQKIFTAVAQAGRVFGLSAEQQEGAFLAVQQMISKGKVSAEELRGQLGERLPGSFQIFARSLGISTQELDKLLEQGKVGMDDLYKFALQLEKETAQGVAGATKTSGASLQRLQNEITDFKRNLGDAIAPAVVVAFDLLSNTLSTSQKNAKLVKAAIIGMAGALTIVMLPSIIAVGGALFTFATVTIPLATTAMLAFVAANPFAIAAIAALTVGMVVAEDAAKGLATAITGVTQAQIDQADADATFDNKLTQGMISLAKQVPLTKEKLDELTNGLQDQVNRGERSRSSAQALTAQLQRMQTQALETAKAQDTLNDSLVNSETAFKKAKNQAEQFKLDSESSLSKQRATGFISEEGVRAKELEQEQAYSKNLLQVYQSRIADINRVLQESSRLQKSGRKGLEAKQERELREELLTVQKEYTQAEINLLKSQANQSKEVREARLKDFDEAIQIQENYQKTGLASEQQSIDAIMKIRVMKAQEELAQIRDRRSKLNIADKEGLEALAVQESEVYARMADARKTRFDEQIELVKAASTREMEALDAQQKQGLISEEQAAKQRVAIAEQAAKKQVAMLRTRLPEARTNTQRQELILQEQQLAAAIAEERKAAYQKSQSEIQSREQAEIAQLTASRSQSLVTERQFNEQQYQIKLQSLDEQLKLVRDRRSQLNATDVQGLRELQKAESEIIAARTQAQQAFLDSQIALLERSQQKAQDILTLSAKETEIAIAKLLNERLISQEESQLLLNKSAQDAIALQLEQEKERMRVLDSVRYSDPTAEEDRQTKIRQSRIKTSELTLQLIQGEKQQQESLFRVVSQAYERFNQQVANGVTQVTQSLEKQINFSNLIEKTLTMQNSLLEARKSLYNSFTSYLQTEYQILGDTAKTEREKQKYAKEAADAKLQAAITQVELDRQSLELQIQQSEAAQRRLEIENAIAQIKNQADIAAKKAQIATTQADPNATAEQIDAAKLQLTAAIAEGEGLKDQAKILQQQKTVDAQINQSKRQANTLEGRSLIRRAQYESANTITNPGQRRRALRELRQEALNARSTPLTNFFANTAPLLPALPTAPITGNIPNANEFGAAVNQLLEFVNSKLSSPTQVTITAPITNNIDSSSGKKIDVTGDIRKQLYDLGLELKRSK